MVDKVNREETNFLAEEFQITQLAGPSSRKVALSGWVCARLSDLFSNTSV